MAPDEEQIAGIPRFELMLTILGYLTHVVHNVRYAACRCHLFFHFATGPKDTML